MQDDVPADLGDLGDEILSGRHQEVQGKTLECRLLSLEQGEELLPVTLSAHPWILIEADEPDTLLHQTLDVGHESGWAAEGGLVHTQVLLVRVRGAPTDGAIVGAAAAHHQAPPAGSVRDVHRCLGLEQVDAGEIELVEGAAGRHERRDPGVP
jgi:hypothetical protein